MQFGYIAVDVCESDPCLNNGSCVAAVDDTYYCTCSSGYHGDNCELVDDPCLTAMCLNDGTCVRDDVNSDTFTCQCTASANGDLCENLIGNMI